MLLACLDTMENSDLCMMATCLDTIRVSVLGMLASCLSTVGAVLGIAIGRPAGMPCPLANTVLTSAGPPPGGIVILSSFLWTVLDLASSVSSKPSAVPEEGRVAGGTGSPIGESFAVSLVL